MRTLAITSILAGVAFAAAGSAHADTFGAPIGSGRFMFSDAFVGALAGGAVQYTPPMATIPEQPDTFTYSAFKWTSMTVDNATNTISNLSERDGGAIISMAAKQGISSGGSLTISDFSLDLLNKQVKATIVGANGVGTLTDFALWTFDPATTVPGTYVPLVNYVGETGALSITADGKAKLIQALGLLPLSKAALSGITDYGSIGWNFVAPAGAVPEASTWAMTLLGLGAIGAAAQRRRKQA